VDKALLPTREKKDEHFPHTVQGHLSTGLPEQKNDMATKGIPFIHRKAGVVYIYFFYKYKKT